MKWLSTNIAGGLACSAQLWACVLPSVSLDANTSKSKVDASVNADESGHGWKVTDKADERVVGMDAGAINMAGASGARDSSSSAGGGGTGQTTAAVHSSMADASPPGTAASMPLLPSGAGIDGWNPVPAWSADSYPTLNAESRHSVVVTPTGDKAFELGRAFAIRQGTDAAADWLNIIEVRNVASSERCEVSAVVSWPESADSTWGGFTVRVNGSIRSKGNAAPVSTCLAPRELGYFIVLESNEVANNPSITTLRLTLESEEAFGYQAPGYRLVPGIFAANTVRFVNTGKERAPVTYSNRIVQLILDKDGLPLGASVGAAGYGLPGPAMVEPGAEIAYEMTKLIPRIVGDADRMLLLVAEY